MYATNQRIIARTRGMRGLRGMGDGTTAGAAAGTVALGPGAGTLIGGLIGGLFKGGTYTGPSVESGLMNWAQQGRFDILQRIATTGRGPHWSQPDKYPDPPGIAYGGNVKPSTVGVRGLDGMTTQAFAGWLVQQGQGSAGTITIPQNANIGIINPVNVTIPGAATRTGSAANIPAEVAAVLAHVAAGQSLTQAVQTAVSLGEVSAADAASVGVLAGQAKSGVTQTTYGGMNVAALASNPLVLVGGLALVLMLAKRGRR
jgi:hypothetical protein